MKLRIACGRGQDTDPAPAAHGVLSSLPHKGRQEDTFLSLIPIKCFCCWSREMCDPLNLQVHFDV